MNKPVVKLVAGLGLLCGSLSVYGANLMEVYQVALENDPQLQAATAAHLAALQAKPQARAALLPQLSASANYQRNAFDIQEATIPITASTGSYNSNGYSLNLQQAVYHRDYFVRLKQADARLAQADAQYTSVRQAEIYRVSEAYFRVLGAQDNLDFAQAERKAIAQQLRQAKQRFEVGLTAITDVRESQAGYDLAVSREITAKNTLDTAWEQLREITGQSFPSLARLGTVPLVPPDPADIDAWVKTAMDQNLQLLAAQAGADVARNETELQRSGHYPTLDIVASHAYEDTINSPTFGFKQNTNTIGLQLSVPIYQGGLISSRTRQAEQLYNQALANLDQQRRATTRQTRDAYMSVTAAISQVKASKVSLESTQTALEATQAGFEVGTRTAVEVLNAQQAVFGAKRDYARARYDYILSTLNLRQAAGSLNINDLRKVNTLLQ